MDMYVIDRLNLDKQGKVTGIRTTLQDITKRRQVEENLKQAHAELGQIFNSTNPMCVIDIDFTITRINKTFMELYDIAKDTDLIGRKCFEVWT